MSEFRGSDESLDREIAATESIARTRLRRYAREMRELDRELAELRRIRARRRAAAEVPQELRAPASATGRA
jgi:hypothetical protein